MKLSETAAKLLRERFLERMKNHTVLVPEEQFKRNWELLLRDLMLLDFAPLPPSQSELEATNVSGIVTDDSLLGIRKFKKG